MNRFANVLRNGGILVDRRVIKTRKEIRKACIELIEEKGFEAMTVLDIAERANINRGTFYLHYIDKYDLLDKYEEELFEKIQAVINLHLEDSNTIEQLFISRYPTLVQIFESLYNEQELLKILLNTKGIFSLQEKIHTFFYSYINEIILRLPEVTPKYSIDFIALFVSSTFIATLQYWLKQDMKQTPDELASSIIDIVFNGPIQAVGIIPLDKKIIDELLSKINKTV